MSITEKLARYVANYENPRSIGSKLRARRIAPLLEMIAAVHKQNGCVRIVDIGGTKSYWNIISERYLQERAVTITLVNLPCHSLPEDDDIFKYIEANGCNLECFLNDSFDITHSNSVIEHVGDWENMVRFSKEASRISKKLFIQTPSYWFPIEPHCMTPFFHWLPKPTRIWLVSKFQLGHWKRASSVDEAVRIVESARLLNKDMFRELFKSAHVSTERFLFIPKSFVAMRK